MQVRMVSSLAFLSLVVSLAAAPVPEVKQEVEKRANISSPIVSIDLGDISEFSPIEDGFLEFDNDSGGETENGGDANSVSNGLLGQGGTGSSAHSNGSATSSSSFCSLTGCTSGSGAANNNNASTSTDSSSLTLIGGPLVSVGSVGRDILRRLRLL